MTADRWIDIDLGALRDNLTLVRETIRPAHLLLVVKDDAYGHGLWPVVRTAVAAGVSAIGTLDVDTALHLRAGGIAESVTLFAWQLVPDAPMTDAVDARVDLGVSSLTELTTIARHESGRAARIHLKIDTGLGRSGARAEDWPALVRAGRAFEADGVVEIVGVWTHIAEASFSEDTASIEAFRRAIDLLQEGRDRPVLRHLAASAASFSRADSRFDLARVGAFAYGIAPGGGIAPGDLGLRPVMALRARVVAIDGQGRGRLPIGAADGLPTVGGGVLEASLNGSPIAIDRIDITEVVLAPGTVPGDTITLFGDAANGERTLQDWADAVDTIGEELVVRLTQRIERRTTG